jgi:hypothetical protein
MVIYNILPFDLPVDPFAVEAGVVLAIKAQGGFHRHGSSGQ